MPEKPSQCRGELLVEPVLERQGTGTLLGIGGIQRWFGGVLFEGGDNRRRVPDPASAEHEHGQATLCATGEHHRAEAVQSGDRDAALMRNALEVEGPPCLLAVGRKLEVPKDDGHATATLRSIGCKEVTRNRRKA